MPTATCPACDKTDFAPAEECRGCGAPYDADTLARIAADREREASGPAPPPKRRPFVMVTTPEVPRRDSVEALGIVTAEVVVGANIFRDLFASITDVLGGRSNSYQNVLRKAKAQAQSELQAQAIALGADAVVGVDIDYSEISGDGKSMLFLVMAGTAVKLSLTGS